MMSMKKTALLMGIMVIFLSACSLPVMTETAAPEPAMTPEATTEPTPAPTEAPTVAESETPTPEPEAPAAPLTVNNRALVYSNDDVDVQIACPEISGMQDAVVQSGINEGVYNYLADMAHSIEALSQQDTDQSGPHGIYRMESEFSVERNDGRVLSVRIDITTYEGGANVGTDAAFVNVINKQEAAQPTLPELFTEGTDYEAALNEQINAQIAADPESDVFSFSGISSGQWYYLTENALVLVFPSYSIAPGAYGVPEFSIPFADIADILIPEIQ